MSTYLVNISKLTLAAVFLSISVIACTTSSFEIKATSASVQAGDSTTVNVDIVRSNFDTAVSLSVANVPTGITASFNEESSTADNVSLKLDAAATTAAGTYTLKVIASAGELLKAASFDLTVTKAKVSNTAPTVSITNPATDSSVSDSDFIYDGFDNTKNLWYKDLTLVAEANDAEDGALTGDSLVWSTNQTDVQDAQLGTGASLTTRLYSNECFGARHDITLSVTDSDGNTQTALRSITIWTIC